MPSAIAHDGPPIDSVSSAPAIGTVSAADVLGW